MDIIERALASARSNVLEIEQRTDLTDDDKSTHLIKLFSAICAGVAVQPLPFADIVLLTPIQAYMGSRIAAVRGVPVTNSTATDLVKEIGGVVGLGFAAQQFVVGLYKTIIPYLGALTTIPLVFGVTYAMGRVMDAYFSAKAQGREFSDDEIRTIWEDARREGQAEGRRKKGEIVRRAKREEDPRDG